MSIARVLCGRVHCRGGRGCGARWRASRRRAQQQQPQQKTQTQHLAEERRELDSLRDELLRAAQEARDAAMARDREMRREAEAAAE